MSKRAFFAILSLVGLVLTIFSFVLFSERQSAQELILKTRNASITQLANLLSPLLKNFDVPGVHRLLENTLKNGQISSLKVSALNGSKSEVIFSSGEISCARKIYAVVEFDAEAVGNVEACFADGSVASPNWVRTTALLLTLLTIFAIFFAAFNFIISRDTKRFLEILERAWEDKIFERYEKNPFSHDSRLAQLFDKTKEVFQKISRASEVEKRALELEAIARTTQMLAHDVRKPFTLVGATLGILKNTPPERLVALVDQLTPEIEQSLQSVNGMIADILQIGNKSKPSLEPTNFLSTLNRSLSQIARIYPESNIGFSYSFAPDLTLNIDRAKIDRVLSNIIGNAFQAMEFSGELLFFATPLSNGMSEIKIRNTGSRLPEGSENHIFDAFFTSGKKEGTGLGLAIAKKIVQEHGGTIACISGKDEHSAQDYTEFRSGLINLSSHFS